MKKQISIDINEFNEWIEQKKDSFRENQRRLPFGEKMQIAFSLAERDKTIQHAVLLRKNKNKVKK